MADSLYQAATVTTTAKQFGSSETGQQFIWQCPTTNTVPVFIIPRASATVVAVKSVGFNLEPGKDISSDELPEFMKQGPYSCVVSTGTETLYITNSKARSEAV